MRAGWPPQLLWPPLPATARTRRPAPTMPLLFWTPRELRQTLARIHPEQHVEGVKALKRWGSYLLTEPKRLTLFQGPASLWPFSFSIYSTGSFTRYFDMKMYISSRERKGINYSCTGCTHTLLYCYSYEDTRSTTFISMSLLSWGTLQDDLTSQKCLGFEGNWRIKQASSTKEYRLHTGKVTRFFSV